jgi:hypothetical protein
MSCADVCLDMGGDGCENDFYSESIRTARKPHVCVECQLPIAPGHRYWHAAGKSDGAIWAVKTCALCYEIRCAFVCGGWLFGCLWDEIEAVMFPVWETESPIDCLAKVESLEARTVLRSRYEEWQRGQR